MQLSIAKENKLTPKKLANACGVHPNTIRGWADKGYIRHVERNKRNNRRVFCPEALEEVKRIVAKLREDGVLKREDKLIIEK